MNSILVPTDFSENANTAIEYACELTKSLNAEVLVVNIYTPAVSQFGIASPVIKEETEVASMRAEEKLTTISEIVKEQYGPITITFKFVVGDLVESIQELASESNVNLVVMGTRGASGLSKFFFGSNTARVLEKVKCPVLVIPLDSPFHVPKRIVYATDFHNAELNHITELVSVAKTFNSELMMIHITTSKESLFSEEILKRNFAKRVNEITDYKPITFFVKYEEDIRRALESYAKQVDADWIALLTHQRSLLEKLYNPSLTKSLSYHTEIPLLAIKD